MGAPEAGQPHSLSDPLFHAAEHRLCDLSGIGRGNLRRNGDVFAVAGQGEPAVQELQNRWKDIENAHTGLGVRFVLFSSEQP